MKWRSLGGVNFLESGDPKPLEKTNEYPLADEEWILDGVCQIVRGLKLQGTMFCGENYHPKRMVQPNFDPR